MKTFLLLVDLIIAAIYMVSVYLTQPQSFYAVLIIMLYFLALRALSLTLHPLFAIGNVLIGYLLWKYDPKVLLLMYVLYIGLYFYLNQKEQEHRLLEEQNTLLQVQSAHLRKEEKLRENYELQLEENLRLEERRRIAQEIHDLLGHTMVSAILQLEAANSVLRDQPDQATGMIERSTTLLRQGMDTIRATLREMKTDTAEVKLSQLELLFDKLRSSTSLEIFFHKEGDLQSIPTRYWNTLYQNTAEALGNTLKHAHAKTATVRLQALPQMIRLEVSDDGIGLRGHAEGMGMQGMRERAEELEGKLLIDGQGGTRITTLLPRKDIP